MMKGGPTSGAPTQLNLVLDNILPCAVVRRVAQTCTRYTVLRSSSSIDDADCRSAWGPRQGGGHVRCRLRECAILLSCRSIATQTTRMCRRPESVNRVLVCELSIPTISDCDGTYGVMRQINSRGGVRPVAMCETRIHCAGGVRKPQQVQYHVCGGVRAANQVCALRMYGREIKHAPQVREGAQGGTETVPHAHVPALAGDPEMVVTSTGMSITVNRNHRAAMLAAMRMPVDGAAGVWRCIAHAHREGPHCEGPHREGTRPAMSQRGVRQHGPRGSTVVRAHTSACAGGCQCSGRAGITCAVPGRHEHCRQVRAIRRIPAAHSGGREMEAAGSGLSCEHRSAASTAARSSRSPLRLPSYGLPSSTASQHLAHL